MADASGASASPLQILLVEDDLIDQRAIAEAIRASELHADLIVAATFENGARHLSERVFDCALIDLRLGARSGMDLLMDTGATPAVILTGSGTEDTAVRALRAGALDYIIKDTGDYLSLIAPCIRRVAARRQERVAEQARTDNLSRSHDDLEDFASILAHDLRAPLRHIRVLAGLVRPQVVGPAGTGISEELDQLEATAARMDEMILALQEYSSLAQPAGLESVDLALVLGSVRQDLEEALADADGDLVVEGALPVVFGSIPRMRQLLQNLIGNALKFRGDAPPKVTVSARREGAAWAISVADRGIGIGADLLPRIFRPFERLSSGGTQAGTGMGLAICKKIVEQRGGTIEVTSRPGEGTVFTFLWPD